jgi:hypothetical protein
MFTAMRFLCVKCMCLLLMQASGQERGLGVGCYDHIDQHKCDCTVTEQHCTEVRGHTWTDGCTSCDAEEGINHPECNKEHSWGCFDQEKHACECEVSQVTCNADMSNGKSWTHQCWSCCYTTEWGCYIPGSGCHCTIPEGACQRDFPSATWSNQCHECNPTSDPTQKASADDNDDSILVVAIVSSASVLFLAFAIVGFVLYRMRASNGKPVDAPPSVVVGVPANENSEAIPKEV